MYMNALKYIERNVTTHEKEWAEASTLLDTNNKGTNGGLSVVIKWWYLSI